MIVWREHAYDGYTRKCGHCSESITKGARFAEVLTNPDDRAFQRPLIRCEACGQEMERAREAARLAALERQKARTDAESETRSAEE